MIVQAATRVQGFAAGMPVGLQLVCARHRDAELLDIAEDLEEALGFDGFAVIRAFSGYRVAEANT